MVVLSQTGGAGAVPVRGCCMDIKKDRQVWNPPNSLNLIGRRTPDSTGDLKIMNHAL